MLFDDLTIAMTCFAIVEVILAAYKKRGWL